MQKLILAGMALAGCLLVGCGTTRAQSAQSEHGHCDMAGVQSTCRKSGQDNRRGGEHHCQQDGRGGCSMKAASADVAVK